MSEESSVDILVHSLEGVGEGALDKAAEKVAEASLMRTLAVLSEAVNKTMLDSSTWFKAASYVSERNRFWEMAANASEAASRAVGARKAQLQLEALSFRSQAISFQARFLAEFAPATSDFAAGIRQFFGITGEKVGHLLGPIVGGVLMRVMIDREYDKLLATPGVNAEKAAQIVAEKVGLTSSVIISGLVEKLNVFIRTGVLPGTNIALFAKDARIVFALTRAAASGAILGLVFEGAYRFGEFLYEQPIVNEFIADRIDEVVARITQDSTLSRYPSDVEALGLVTTRIDPELTREDFNAILQASAPTFRDMKELNAFLGKLIKLFTPSAPDFNAATSDQFVQGVIAAKTAAKRYAEGQLHLEALVTPAAIQGAQEQAAGSGGDARAYRYALRQLNPFVVKGIDYSKPEYNGNGELDLYDPNTDKGNITEEWLKARADMLTAYVAYNTQDGWGGEGITKTYIDKITNTTIGQYQLGTDTIAFGGDGIDSLSGGVGDDRIFGGAGGDTISAGILGDDYIEGNDGYDTIDAGLGKDTVYGGVGNDTIDGGGGEDKLYGGDGQDTIKGGSGVDIIYGDRKDEPDSVLITGDDTIDGEGGNDQIWGGAGKDTIHGGDDVDTIEGNADDDTLYGDKGADNIKGGKGVDTIYGGEGFDTIDGEDEGDTIYGGDGAADDKKFGNNIKGGKGDDFLYGDGGGDTIDGGENKDLIVGNFGADTLTGGSGNDEIYGDIKDKDAPLGDKDRLDGGAGNDELYGGGGKDVLFGAEDDDILRGGAFAGDFMVGGEGYDTYIYFSRDQIDFISDEDGEGEIQFDGVTLGVATSEHEGELVWYDTGNRCTATFRFIAYGGDPDEGPVTLMIDNLRQTNDGLEIVGFQNGDLGITLEDGDLPDPNPSCPTPPPPPPQFPGVPNRGDPLVIDLGTPGIATYGLAADMHLDMDGDGFAERVGFAGPQEGVLVLDRNGDGILNNGAELFGEFTPLGGGQLAVNGFQALSQFDRNKDGVIDALDPVWGSLRVGVWETDPFGNVIVADPGAAMSFRTMEELGIQSIGVGSTIVENQGPDGSGNTKTRTGSLTFTGGGTTEVAQYTFARDTSDTRAIDFTPVPPSIEQGPHLKLAGGPLATLKQALARDATGGYLGKPAGTLQAKLDAFLSEANVANRYARFEDLLFAWSGADAIPAGAKTNDLDARHARVLEKAYGRSFQNPNADQASVWQTTYESLAETMYGSLMSQTHFKSYYDAIDWERNEVTGKQFGDLAAVQASLDALLVADPVNGRATVNEFGRTLRGVQLTRNTDYMVFREHFTGGGANPDLSFAFDAVGKPQQTLTGTAPLGYKFFTNFTEAVHSYPAAFLYVNGGLNVIYADNTTFGGGTWFHDESHLVGGPDADVIVVGRGHDYIFAHEGNDILDGGDGSDYLIGADGDDTYVFRRGSGTSRDIIVETRGTDTLFFADINREDIFAHRVAGKAAEIIIDSGDRIYIPPAGSGMQAGWNFVRAETSIERVMFGDGTLMKFEDLFGPTQFGDLLDGTPGADTIDALAGDDSVDGREGADLLLGAAGADTLAGGAGNDVLDGGADDDMLLGTVDDPTSTALVSYYWLYYNGGASNGNDTYRFGFGDGHDTVVDVDTGANVDTVEFKAGVRPEDVTRRKVGDDLVLELTSGDTLTIRGHYSFSLGFASVEQATFADGTVWDANFLNTVIGTPFNDFLFSSGRSTFFVGLAGDDFIQGSFRNESLDGGDGNDILDGGQGADVLDGGAGDDLLADSGGFSNVSVGVDTFLFGRGEGNDVVDSKKYFYGWPYATAGVLDIDVVRFKAGVAPEDLVLEGGRSENASFFARSSDLVVTIAGDAGSSLRVLGFFGGTISGSPYTSSVGRFEFDDGTVWDLAQIADRTVWRGTEDNDTLRMGSWNDHVFALGGNDFVQGAWGDDVIDAGDGNDAVFGDAGNDIISGGAGNDLIDPGSGNDLVDGGAGDDVIGAESRAFDRILWVGATSTTAGDLTIEFGRGDGHDTVQVSNSRADSNDTLRMKPGVALADVGLARVNEDLLVTIRDTGDSVRLRSWFTEAFLPDGRIAHDHRVENIAFDDVTLDAQAIRARVLVGGEGNDVLKGYDDGDDLIVGNGGNDQLFGAGGADRLTGGAGDDFLDGNFGDDVYVFGLGDGNDTILTTIDSDAVELTAGVSSDEVLVRNRGGSAVLTLSSGETLTIAHQFDPFFSGIMPVREVRFAGGEVWDADMLRERALTPTAGDDVIEGFDYTADFQDSNDFLTGGGGNDSLEGGGGNDYFLFESGHVTVSDRWGFDTLSLGVLTLDDVSITVSEGTLTIEVVATGDTVSIDNFSQGPSTISDIEQFLFDDGGVSLNAFQVFLLSGAGDLEQVIGTEFDDELFGSDRPTLMLAFEGDDFGFGGGGNDQLFGGSGADTLYGETGDDTISGEEDDDALYGGEGADELSGNSGSDSLYGGEGDDDLDAGDDSDWLEGGQGDDRIEGGSGEDTIMLGLGDGLDDVIGEQGGSGVTVREGLGMFYDEAQDELAGLDDLNGEPFLTRYWSRLDGGPISHVPDDLYARLADFRFGVDPEDAREVLEELSELLITPLREGYEWSNEDIEEEARLELRDIRELRADGDENGDGAPEIFTDGYWYNLDFDHDIPGDILRPLEVLHPELGGLPLREAEVALQSLLAWVHLVPSAGEGEAILDFVYGEMMVELEEAALTGGDDFYFSDYWRGSDDYIPGEGYVPEEILDPLQDFHHGVSRDDALEALQRLKDYLLPLGGSAADEDTIEFGEGITPDDLEVATLESDGNDDGGYGGGSDGGYGGYGGGSGGIMELSIGIRRTNDGVIVSDNGERDNLFSHSTPVTDLSVQRFRFADGSELSLDQIIAMADGTIGDQEGTGDDDTLIGSAADENLRAGSGNDILIGRGGDDWLRGQSGDDLDAAGAGNDEVDGGPGDDLIIGDRGDDEMRGGPGNDVFAFNRHDGADYISAFASEFGDIDTLSFGADITPDMVQARVDADGTLTLLLDGGDDGSIAMAWYDPFSGNQPYEQAAIQRAQFIDADGRVRVFDLEGLVASRQTDLAGTASTGALVSLFDDAAAFELTGTVIPAGGKHAVAYAQFGDPFADPVYNYGNGGTEDDDVIIGGDGIDAYNGFGGDDLISLGGGDDFADGSTGDDQIDGGAGDDVLLGGGGNDVLAGGDGDDEYYVEQFDGTLTIVDDAQESGPNTLFFGYGIFPDALRLSYDTDYLVIDTGTPGDQVRLSNFNAAAVFDGWAVDGFEFFESGFLYYSALISLGFDLDGTVGGDTMFGTDVVDRITGLEGDDLLWGLAGDDTLDGGEGSDTYHFDEFDGFDTLIDRESAFDHNVLEFGFGIDPFSVYAWVEAGDLLLGYGAQGDVIRMPEVDLVQGSAPFDLMRFFDGTTRSFTELLAAGIGFYGTPDIDVLTGSIGGDFFDGRESDDTLAGGEGSDVYYVYDGSGLDTIVDGPGESGFDSNMVEFNHSGAYSLDDFSITFDRAAGTLILRVNGTSDGVALAGFDPDHPFGAHAADAFVLDTSGVVFSYDDILARGFELEGTAEGDVLLGSAVFDHITGGDGNDVIDGGEGGDLAEGGAGDDVYVFNRGDGSLTIRDDIAQFPENGVVFGPGITLADIHNNLRFEAPDPVAGTPGLLRIGVGGGEEVVIEGFDPFDPENGLHAVQNYLFDDGTLLSYRELVLNTFIVQGDFTDDLLFGTNTQDRLYGFEGFDELHALDGNDTLTGGTDDDLLMGGLGADMYVFHAGDGHDTIIDSGDNFDGNFISFADDVDPSTIAAVQDGGDMVITYGMGDSIRIVGWDPAHPAIREIRLNNDPFTAFTLASLENVAPVVVTALENQVVHEDQALVPYQFDADAFADPESGDLTYYATLADGNALPSWLEFDPTTRTFSGTPENIDVTVIPLEVLVTATDAFGAMATQSFTVEVLNENDAPVLAAAAGDQGATQGEYFELVLPMGEFTDADGDTLTLSVTQANGDALPDWLQFDASTGTLSGTPANGDVGSLDLVVTATDPFGAFATDAFTLGIENVNDAPTVAVAIADQTATEDAPFTFTVDEATFADIDAGDSLITYATLGNGDLLPNWLAYDPATRTFSGTPTNDEVGSIEVRVHAVDSFGAAASDVFTLTVQNTNDAPVTEADFASVFEDGLLAAAGNVLDNDTDEDAAAVLAVVGYGVYEGAYGTLTLAYDGTYSYVFNNEAAQSLREEAVATDTFAFEVTDGFVSTPVAGSLVVLVTGANDAPVAIDDVAALTEDDMPATGSVLANDTDPDFGDVLTVSTPGTYAGTHGTLTLDEFGSYIYVQDDAAVQSLGEGQSAQDIFTYEMTDGFAIDSAELRVTIAGANDAPIVANAIDGQSATEDSLFEFTLPVDTFFDVDAGDTLTYSVGGLPTWLSFDAATGAFSGTPTNDDVGILNLVVTATDGHGAFVNTPFTIAVGNVNDNPVAVIDTANVSEDGTTSASGNVLDNDYDIDVGTVLTVSNPGTYHGTYGTLVLSDTGAYSYTLANGSTAVQRLREGQQVTDVFAYGASDGIGVTTSTLRVTVTGKNDAPVAVNDTASVQEDGVTIASASVLTNDTDADAGATLSVANAGTYAGLYGTLTLYANGTYSYALDNASSVVQGLRAGQTVFDVFGYSVTDGFVTTTGGQLTVSVSGKNDAPVGVADTATGLAEDGTATATGNVLTNDIDADVPSNLSVSNAGSFTGTYGSLSLAGNGFYTYSLNNASAAVQSLAAGQTVTDVFAYTVTDGTVSSSSTLTATITGANDAPVTVNDSASVQEDTTLSAAGGVLGNDSDVDAGSSLTVSNWGTYAGTYGTLALNQNGTYTYALDNAAAAVQALRGGQTALDAFSYIATDGTASTPGTLTVSVRGTNDAPVTAGDSASVAEDGMVSASGNVLDNDTDRDSGTTLQIGNAGTYTGAYGTLTLNQNGSYAYALNNASSVVQGLRTGQSVADVFSYMATDGTASTPGALTIAVAGANDAPVVANPIADQTAPIASAYSFTVAANAFTDADQGDTLSYAASRSDGSALPAWLSFDAASRTFSGTPVLADTGTVQVLVSVTDTTGLGTSDVFTLNVGTGAIIGTPGNDLLLGTPADDTIEGRAGNDILLGKDGNDTMRGEDGNDSLNGGNGNDLLQGGNGNDALTDTSGSNVLEGGAGNDALVAGSGSDVLAGGTGNDSMSGGAGNDLYVYELSGGHDTIADSGGIDTLILGAGITSQTVTLKREGDDLVLDVAGSAGGKVTMLSWFDSSAKRIEKIQFANGTAWNESQIRDRVQHDGGSGGSNPCGNGGDNHGDWGHGDHDDEHDDRDGHRSERDRVADAIADRMRQAPRFDFETLMGALGSGARALSATEIARRWSVVQNYASALGESGSGADDRAALLQSERGLFAGLLNTGNNGWGYDGSTGSRGAPEGFQTLQGLTEGLKKL